MVFKQATYHVTEGPGAKATITVKTVVQRDYPFDVVVSTRSGRAGGKCPLVTYRQGFSINTA